VAEFVNVAGCYFVDVECLKEVQSFPPRRLR